MESVMKTKLAQNLSTLRKEKQLSQRQAATHFGISQALLSHYENDAREPGIEFIIKACDYYAVTADFLIGRSSDRGDGASRLALKISEAVDALEELRLEEDKMIDSIRDLITAKE